MPALTVVVPVRDGAATLARCLTALVAGLPGNAEVVVVDDGSMDDTAAIAARFPVRLVRLPVSRGASGARNAGIATSDAPVLAFVDADIVVRPDALGRLAARLDAEPRTLGANGLLALDLTTPGLVSAFTNTSLHYQHLRHGERVASAFTSLCVLRRDALDRMGGWEGGTSRYADDVATRWHLPPRSIVLVPEAQAEHLKYVHLRGLLLHRVNVGYFFVASLLAHQEAARAHPRAAILALRYPLNATAAALTVAALPGLLVLPPVAAATLLVPALIFLGANAHFAYFTLRHRGGAEALVAIPISALEGFAYIFGMGWSATVAAWRDDARSSTAAGTVRPPLREGGAGEQAPHAEAVVLDGVRDRAVRAELRALLLPRRAARG
jgi:hypothetical protein